MTEGLKPCPCCGSNRLHIFAMDDGVKCLDCGVKITGVSDWKERWNRRASEIPGEIVGEEEGIIVIAEGQGYAVLRNPGGGHPLFILKGLGRGIVDYVFNRGEWDRFAMTVAYADIKIRGGIE